MSKTFKFNPYDQQPSKNGYNNSAKKAKLSKQQAGRVEKVMLRSSGSDE